MTKDENYSPPIVMLGEPRKPTVDTGERESDRGSIGQLGQQTDYVAGYGELPSDSDLNVTANYFPLGNFFTAIMSRDVFDNMFTVDDPNTESADPKLDMKAQKELRRLKAKENFRKALEKDRTFGYSLLVGGFNDAKNRADLEKPLSDSAQLMQLDVYSKMEIQNEELDTNPESIRYGQTQFYILKRGQPQVTLKVHYTRIYRLSTLGKSVLQPIWGDLTSLYNILWSMGQTMFRVGSGFPVITVPQAKTKEELQTWTQSGPLQNIMHRTGIVMGEGMTLEFKGAQGAVLNPQPFYDATLESISGGTGVPKTILRGAQVGQLMGAEADERKYFKIISGIQSDCDEMCRWVVDRILKVNSSKVDALRRFLHLKTEDAPEAVDYELNWLGGFELSPIDDAQRELIHEQANVQKLQYMTVDEVRVAEGELALPDGEGEVCQGTRATPQPSFGGFGNMAGGGDVASVGSSRLLSERLRHLITRIKAGEITKDEALISAKKFIDDQTLDSHNQALEYLQRRTGKKPTDLPPESNADLERRAKQYLSDFTKILDDSLQAAQP